jgi:uncharacterized protein (TIGR00251 family)
MRREGSDVVLYVKLTPNARRDEILGVRDGALLVKVAAPPAEGRANRRLSEVLAQAFGVPKSRVLLERGAGSRHKCLRIKDPGRWPQELQKSMD